MSGYLDAAAGLPLSPAARAALLAALDDGWADPARLYGAARRAALLLEGARDAVADVLGARSDEVSFAPSGTLAAHLAVLGRIASQPGHVLHSAVEHSCVLAAVRSAAGDGGTGSRGTGGFGAGGTTSSVVPVDRLGRVDVDGFAPRPGTSLGCLISASHEVGTVQPVEAVAERLGDVPLLVDAAQSVGRVPVPTGWSLLTASARKWGGPPGVGVLAVRTGVRWRSPLPADEHERGRVPGGVGLPQVLSAAVGLQAAVAESASEDARLRPLVDRLRAGLAAVPDVEVVGDPVDRLPHLVAFSSPYLDGETLTRALDREGFAVSSGSSCTASTLEPSHVLAAMGLLTHGNVRLSLSRDTTDADVDRFLEVLPRLIAEQQ